MKHIDRFLSLLDGVKQSGNGWKARCPCPDHGGQNKGDNNPSLSIAIGEENKILVFCFAGCPHDAILDAIGLDASALWPQHGDLAVESDVHVATRSPAKRDPMMCHDIYAALLGFLQLSDAHRKQLRKRGLKDEHIDRTGYRTLSFFEFRNRVVVTLRDTFGEHLLAAPGFVKENGRITAVQVPNGILIPVWDTEQRIVACQVRSDSGDPKYLWFSSSEASCGSPTHVPLRMRIDKSIRITEGPLKADVAFALDGIPTIGIAGVANWRSAVPVLAALGVKYVRLAFDADVQNKKGVALALKEFASALRPTYEVQIDTWPLEQGKGLDDLLLAGHKPTKLMGEAVTTFLDNLPTCQIEEVPIGMEQATLPAPAPPSEPTPIKQPLAESDSEQHTSLRGPEKFPYGAGEPVPFPLDFFPEPLQEVAQEISKAVDAPVDFPACAMIAVSATAIGKSRQIEPKEDWEIAPRIYLGLVGNPGSAKTPAVKKVMRPLWQKNREWGEEYKEKKEVYELEKSIYEVQQKEFLKHVSKNAEEAKARSHEEE